MATLTAVSIETEAKIVVIYESVFKWVYSN